MAYDVFLVSAIEDRDMAKLVARRLRSLKFKVWFDQKQVDNTFDAKDARNAGNSKHMLVMWSEHAVKSDWVRAAASVGHSRPGMLAQVSLDKTIPYEPFKSDKRFSIEGMTSRKTPEGFYKIIDELGQRDGRADLREWMGFGSKDEEAREDWLAAHPDDPLAVDARKKREKALGIKPAPAAETASAAALARASVKPQATHSNGSRPVSSAVSAGAEPLGMGWGTIAAVGAAVLAMFFLSWIFRSQTIVAPIHAVSPGVGNAYVLREACPVGEVPASLMKVLEPGPIVNDTEPTDPED
jgi:TIR domain